MKKNLKNKDSNVRVAFTLAEVLITLGIIGIVAAMTIQSLVSTCNKNIVETRLSYTNAIILQAFRRYQADNGISIMLLDPYEDGDVNGYSWQRSKDFFDEYFAKSFNTTHKYPQGTRFPIYSVTGKTNLSRTFGRYAVYNMLNNGTVIGVVKNGNYDGIRVQVILNPQKKNLRVGRDVFEFQYMSDELSGYYAYNPQLRRHYTEENRGSYLDACISDLEYPLYAMSSAEFCTFLILQNNFKVPKDYSAKL